MDCESWAHLQPQARWFTTSKILNCRPTECHVKTAAGPDRTAASSCRSRWHCSTRIGPHALSPVSQQSAQGCLSKQYQSWSGWTQIVPDLGGQIVDHFLSPLLFPSDDQCCDALACSCPEKSPSFSPPLLCQSVDRLECLLCLPVCLPVRFFWLHHGQVIKSTFNFAAETVHCRMSIRTADFRLHIFQQAHWACENGGIIVFWGFG